MKRLKIAGFVLGAAMAVSAMAAATASAQAPEFGRCKKVPGEMVGRKTVYHGGYSNAACTTANAEAKGKYEWYPGVEKAGFTTASTGAKVIFETVSKDRVTCAAETSTGVYTSPKLEENVVFKFTGCDWEEFHKYSGWIGYTASSAGAAPGEVLTEPTECELGVVKKGETPVKNMLGVTCAEEQQFMWLNWTGPYRGFMGEYELCITGWWFFTTKANSMMMTTTAMKSAESKGRQKIEKFEEGPLELLEFNVNGGPYEQMGLELTTVQTNEEPVEANSVV